MRIIVTGGYGFIGSHLIKFLLKNTDHTVMNVDSLTYASDLERLNGIDENDLYEFMDRHCTYQEILSTVMNFAPDLIMNLAAESHVDTSINAPARFIETNIIGTFNLLQS